MQAISRNIIDLEPYMQQKVVVNLKNGDMLEGKLVSYDPIQNCVLKDTDKIESEIIDGEIIETRTALNTTILRSLAILTLMPAEGFAEIENPYMQHCNEEDVDEEENQTQEEVVE
ncbi:hypothetical protein PCE1_003222 [Barthelona sp. PCE]